MQNNLVKYLFTVSLLYLLFGIQASVFSYCVSYFRQESVVATSAYTLEGEAMTKPIRFGKHKIQIDKSLASYNIATINKKVSKSEREIKYTDFLALINLNKISKVELLEEKVYFEIEGKSYVTDNPNTEDFKEFLLLHDVDVSNKSKPNITTLFTWMFLLLMVSYWAVSLLNVLHIDINPFNNLKKYKKPKTINLELEEELELKNPTLITFNQIEGIDEVKSDFETIIDSLKNPEKYLEMGARPTNGVILEGPPGTGKTLLAKALANEADVPFFSKSGSEFVEKYVGMGAKRVRDLFDKARRNAPCIVFIDEIDAIGKQRSNSLNSNDERESTLNQLLMEMDGFTNSKEPIIVIAATNRAELLDSALTRPGRFDRTIAISLPDKSGRAAILKTHSRNKRVGEDVSFQEIAEMTVGFSGAELAMLMNEAAILAVREDASCICKAHIEKAFFQYIMKGNAKEKQEKNAEDIKLTAYHEAGHALVSKLVTKRPITKVTILSTTSGAGGVTIRNLEDTMCHSKEYLKNEVMVCYGGRVGEMILYQNEEKLTTGASQDIKQATSIIKQYITTYGMSNQLGMLNIDYFLHSNQASVVSENKETLQVAIELSKELYQKTEELLYEHKEQLVAIAELLLAKETITDDDINAILGVDYAQV